MVGDRGFADVSSLFGVLLLEAGGARLQFLSTNVDLKVHHH
jgi:hypothetical protein